jgi:hypothetical protein
VEVGSTNGSRYRGDERKCGREGQQTAHGREGTSGSVGGRVNKRLTVERGRAEVWEGGSTNGSRYGGDERKCGRQVKKWLTA